MARAREQPDAWPIRGLDRTWFRIGNRDELRDSPRPADVYAMERSGRAKSGRYASMARCRRSFSTRVSSRTPRPQSRVPDTRIVRLPGYRTGIIHAIG